MKGDVPPPTSPLAETHLGGLFIGAKKNRQFRDGSSCMDRFYFCSLNLAFISPQASDDSQNSPPDLNLF